MGNWVADEVLWHSRLHPEQPVAALQQEHIAALHQALHNVVQTAVAANADSSKFPPDWMFHVRCGACAAWQAPCWSEALHQPSAQPVRVLVGLASSFADLPGCWGCRAAVVITQPASYGHQLTILAVTLA